MRVVDDEIDAAYQDALRPLAVGSLFSGVGGLDLGLERAGMQVRWQCEIDDYATKVLEKHWPAVARFRDVRECGRYNLQPVDLICGGTPCQPVSKAGRRQAQEDLRWLWPEFARIVRELRPRYVLLENVPGLLKRGFGDVLGDLARLGFDAEWQSISAAAFGALHFRERVFLIAYRSGERMERICKGPIPRVKAFSWCQNVRGVADLRNRSDLPEPLVRRSGDGIPFGVEQLRCLGNAVVPQAAEWIGRLIVDADQQARMYNDGY